MNTNDKSLQFESIVSDSMERWREYRKRRERIQLNYFLSSFVLLISLSFIPPGNTSEIIKGSLLLLIGVILIVGITKYTQCAFGLDDFDVNDYHYGIYREDLKNANKVLFYNNPSVPVFVFKFYYLLCCLMLTIKIYRMGYHSWWISVFLLTFLAAVLHTRNLLKYSSRSKDEKILVGELSGKEFLFTKTPIIPPGFAYSPILIMEYFKDEIEKATMAGKFFQYGLLKMKFIYSYDKDSNYEALHKEFVNELKRFIANFDSSIKRIHGVVQEHSGLSLFDVVDFINNLNNRLHDIAAVSHKTESIPKPDFLKIRMRYNLILYIPYIIITSALVQLLANVPHRPPIDSELFWLLSFFINMILVEILAHKFTIVGDRIVKIKNYYRFNERGLKELSRIADVAKKAVEDAELFLEKDVIWGIPIGAINWVILRFLQILNDEGLQAEASERRVALKLDSEFSYGIQSYEDINVQTITQSAIESERIGRSVDDGVEMVYNVFLNAISGKISPAETVAALPRRIASELFKNKKEKRAYDFLSGHGLYSKKLQYALTGFEAILIIMVLLINFKDGAENDLNLLIMQLFLLNSFLVLGLYIYRSMSLPPSKEFMFAWGPGIIYDLIIGNRLKITPEYWNAMNIFLGTLVGVLRTPLGNPIDVQINYKDWPMIGISDAYLYEGYYHGSFDKYDKMEPYELPECICGFNLVFDNVVFILNKFNNELRIRLGPEKIRNEKSDIARIIIDIKKIAAKYGENIVLNYEFVDPQNNSIESSLRLDRTSELISLGMDNDSVDEELDTKVPSDKALDLMVVFNDRKIPAVDFINELTMKLLQDD